MFMMTNKSEEEAISILAIATKMVYSGRNESKLHKTK